MRNRFKKSVRFILLLACWMMVFASHAANLPDFTELVESNSDAVVNISTSQKVQKAKQFLPPGVEIPNDGPYAELFRHFFGGKGGQAPQFKEVKSLGSGFIISKDGYLLTNHHVIRDADEIIVRLQDRRELKAKLIGSDERTDVALLKVDAKDLPIVSLGSSDKLKVGEWVFAIGSPFGFDSSVTAGIVSAKGRNLPRENYVPFIQTDVAINPGNSGGPLFNMAGEVVGVNSQIYSRTGGFMGLSFAIPIKVAMNVAEQIKQTGHVARGWLGVRIQDVTRELAQSFGMDKPQGALVAQVISNSPAEKAGLKVGDVIIKFNAKEVIKSSSLPAMVGSASLEGKAKVTIVRERQKQTIAVQLEVLPEDEVLATTKAVPMKKNRTLGMALTNLTGKQRQQLNIDQGGVFVQSVEEGPAAKAGIKGGDIIVQLGSWAVKDVSSFNKNLAELEAAKPIAVLINRAGNPLFLAIKK